MSTTNKVLVWVAAIIVVLGGGYYWYMQLGPAPETASTTTQQPVQNTPAPAAPVDTSDAALVKDAATVDTQLSGLDSDTKAMNSTDVPVTQTY